MPLRWAYAHALADAGRYREAEAELAHYESTLPRRRAEAARHRGQWLYEARAYPEAKQVLARALELDPKSGTAHLYLGLALARTSAPLQAVVQFSLAGELSPALAADAALLGGLTLLESGHEREGMALLERAIEIDPRGDPARYAALVLGERAARGDRIRAELYAGFGYDSNVPLVSSLDLSGLPSDLDDGRGVWGALLSGRIYDGERTSIVVGARYDGSAHFDLGRYDTHQITAFTGGGWAFAERIRARLDGSVSYATRGGDPYAIYGLVSPSLLIGLGERWGVLRASFTVEPIDYDERPLFASLARDGVMLGGSLEQFVPLPDLGPLERAQVDLGAGYSRLETDGREDPPPFEAAYDHHAWRVFAGLAGELPWDVRAEVMARISGEHYDHRSLIGLLTTLDFDRREDTVYEAALQLARPLSQFVDLELTYRFAERNSNIEIYSFDRHIVGFSVRVDAWRWYRERNQP
jgi:tetratricopeptide (TPR) repeat protein